jgi:hypothetical protein
MKRGRWLRAAWSVMVWEKVVDPQRVIFVDELGANNPLSALRA